MKKLLSVLLIAVLVLTASGAAFAASPDQKIVKNEYLYLKELQKLTDEELQARGFDAAAIEELRKIDYAKELKRRAQLDEKELKEFYGYTDEKIKKLKNFKGTEEEVIALAATLTYDIAYYSHGYNSTTNKSTMKVKHSWSWSSQPIFGFTDIEAFAWTDGFSLDGSTSNSYLTVTYQGVGTQTVKYYPSLDSSLHGAYIKFPVLINDPYAFTAWSKSGTGYLTIWKSGRHTGDVTIRGAYGHNQLGLSPSVTFPAGGGISFSTGVVEEDSDWHTSTF
jgi:hypothetical protein